MKTKIKLLLITLILSLKSFSQSDTCPVQLINGPFDNWCKLQIQNATQDNIMLANCMDTIIFNSSNFSIKSISTTSVNTCIQANNKGYLKSIQLGNVAFSNNYSDLSLKPTIPTNTNQLTNGSGFITHDNQTLSISSNTLTISSGNSISLPIYTSTDYANSASIAGGSGQAIFYLTSDKTSSGTALYSTIDYVSPIINDATANYTYQWSYNSSTKSLTVTSKTNLSTNVLTNLLGGTIPSLQPPSNVANGIIVYLLVKGH